MYLFYDHGNNFGDKLNTFIFEALFHNLDFMEKHDKYCFMGLGSILDTRYFTPIPADWTIVPFGAGVRHAHAVQPANLCPEFVRGPISAKAMSCNYIADAAYLLPFLSDYSPLTMLPKQYRLSLMPYYAHTETLDWQALGEETGINIIMPTWPVQKALEAIAQSDAVIAGAMHGCIVADILRVPWARLRFAIHEPEQETQELKWQDWMSAVQVSRYHTLAPKTPNNLEDVENQPLYRELSTTLPALLAEAFTLSADNIYTDTLGKLHGAIHAFSKKYDIAINSYRTSSLAR